METLQKISMKVLRFSLLLTLLCASPIQLLTAVDHPAATMAATSLGLFRADGWNSSSLGDLSPRVFALALHAAGCAVRSGVVTTPSTLAVIDYSKPSTAKRLWVFDLQSRALLYEELVAHGQGTGDTLSTLFSNQPETHRSSLGLFATDEAYTGKNGYSLRLDGLERGFNDRARERAIVMHGAPYVSEDFINARGRLGRSWGCPAINQGIVREVIDRIKGNGLLFSYYPDPAWLQSSKFLGDCGGGSST